MLLPRALTALIGLPLLIAAIYFGSFPFFFVILGIILLGLREFYFLAESGGYGTYPWIGLVGGGLLTLSIYFNGVSFGQLTDNQLTSAFIGMMLIVIVTRSLWRGPADTSLSEWSVTLMGLFYVAWSLSHLLLLRDLRPQGLPATFLLFTMIWVEDVTAYMVGVRFGRRRIAEAISPRKTWEGTLAGLGGAVLAAIAFQQTVLRTQLRVPEAIILALGTGILAFLSDLGESLLKRGAGVKDSSLLLPGHGGILDRFDSFILTAPFFYYYWAFFKH